MWVYNNSLLTLLNMCILNRTHLSETNMQSDRDGPKPSSLFCFSQKGKNSLLSRATATFYD